MYVCMYVTLAGLSGAAKGDESFVQTASIIGLVIRLRAWSQGDLEVEEVVGVCAMRSATDATIGWCWCSMSDNGAFAVCSLSFCGGWSLITFAFGNGCCSLDQAVCSCRHARRWLLRLLCLPAQLGVQAVDFGDKREFPFLFGTYPENTAYHLRNLQVLFNS